MVVVIFQWRLPKVFPADGGNGRGSWFVALTGPRSFRSPFLFLVNRLAFVRRIS